MADLCAVSYVLQVEQVDRIVATMMTVAGIHRALGSDVSMPDPFAMRELFDEALCAEPEYIDPDQLALRQALGLKPGR